MKFEQMTNEEAAHILEAHNEWRSGRTDECTHTTKQLTAAIDVAIAELRKTNPKNKEK